MRIQLNGKPYDSSDGVTVAQLLAHLGIEGNRVAVELNMDILPKQEYATTALKEGDQIEVVHFVGGGTGIGERRKGKGEREKSRRREGLRPFAHNDDSLFVRMIREFVLLGAFVSWW